MFFHFSQYKFDLFACRTSMMEGSGSLEQQLEATKVCYQFI